MSKHTPQHSVQVPPPTDGLPHDVDIRYAEFCSPWDVTNDDDVTFRIEVGKFIARELTTQKKELLEKIDLAFQLVEPKYLIPIEGSDEVKIDTFKGNWVSVDDLTALLTQEEK